MSKIVARYLVVIELTVLFALVFQCNILRGVDPEWFRSHQADSEALVLSGIYHKKATDSPDIPLGFYNYGDGDWVTRVFDHFQEGSFDGLTYGEYNSQYGLQGRLFSVIYETLHTSSRQLLELFNSVINGFIFALFVVWVRDHYGRAESAILAGSVIASTWLIVFSRNLYWVSWTWYLPMLVNGVLLLKRPVSEGRWRFVYVATAATLLVKSLCGYEYLSTIVIMAMVPVVICLIEQHKSWAVSAKRLLLVGLSSIFGFGVALLIHASARAPNLITGLRLIKQDALRRTTGLAGDPSVLQHRSEILLRYLFDWNKPAIAYISVPMWLVLFFALSSAGLLMVRRGLDRRGYALAVAFIFSLLAPLSWFLLAKQHSANHTHMNYVLWYMPTFFLACLCIVRRWKERAFEPTASSAAI